MSIDMTQFHSVFFEESHEHLAEMEQYLLALDLSNPDVEELNSIFRAAHSIKGGSGIFGFDALGSVTHILENLLDKIRQGKMEITADMVDAFLTSVDLLNAILVNYQQATEIDWLSIAAVTETLEAYTNSKKGEVIANEDYGFFDEPDVKVGDGYGFFENRSSVVEEAFGFFESDKEAPSDDAFDFFETTEEKPLNGEKPKNGEKSSGTKKIESNIAQASPVLSPTLKSNSSAPEKNKISEPSNIESTSIRVDVTKVDQLINLVGEIVITQSMLSLLGKSIDGPLAEKFQTVVSELERNTREIQESVMSIRMLPVSFVFNRFPRVVRDLSSKLGKKIDLIIEGGETELDKGLTEKLVDPLTHLVRNSIDHGIESSELRKELGKDPTGTVVLKASQQGGSIVISISDDGSGLSRKRILEKAQEKNIYVGDNPSDSDVWQLIFAPGFSTAAVITDVSGRGVGLDVVKRNVQSLGGRIDIESKEGEGATFIIHLPLTLAIVDGMCVSVGDQTFIIPLVHIVESMQPLEKDIKTLVGNDQLFLVRDKYWPILPLYKAMQLDADFTEPHKGIVVLIESNKNRFALFVDALVGQQQVVIKSLEQHYRRIQGIAGATIMGDGSVALILDVESLAVNVSSQQLQQVS